MTDTTTSDSPVKKSILRSIRAGLQKLLHFILIPVVALIKGLISLLTHLEAELAKI